MFGMLDSEEEKKRVNERQCGEVVKDAAKGAAIGTALAPGVGTVAGAVLGAAFSTPLDSKDDFF